MQKFFRISLFTLIQFVAINSSGQQPIFKTYTVSDGLVNNSVRKVFQDSKGFLWIATWEGLSKYDGNRFINFTESNGLSHNLVNDIAETGDGNIYVAMNNGSVDVISHDKVKQKAILQNVIINKLLPAAKGNLMALTDNLGIIEIHGEKINRISEPSSTSFYSLVYLNDSLVATATDDTVPIQIFNRQFRVWAASKKKPDKAIANCVFKDLQNHLWLATTRGLKLVVINAKREITFPDLPAPFNAPIISQANVTSILQQENGSYWIGTEQGLIDISPGGHLIQLTEKDGLPSRSVSYIFNDRENNLWIGTTMGLAKIIAASPEKIYDPAQESPHPAQLIKKISNEDILILSGNFFYRYNFRTGETQNIAQLRKGTGLVYVTNSIPSLFIYDNQLQVYDVHSNQLNPIKKIARANNFFSATTTDQQNIFIGTFDGIMIYAGNKAVLDATFTMRINNVLADRKGNLWIGTWDHGLYRARYNEEKKQWEDIVHFTQLPDNHIRSLFEDSKGNLWAGTRFNGVVEIREKAPGNFEFIHFSQQTGLSSNWIGDITEDEKENIWLATMSGLDKLIRKENGFSVFNYSRIINFFITTNLVAHIQGNKLLCSTLLGTYQIKDEELEQLSPMPVALTKIGLGSSGQNELAFYNPSEKLILSYSKNHALFEFTSAAFLNEKEILYSYRLRGSGDTTWSHPSNSHSVQYASLEPGRYQFEVRMLGWNGSYGPITSFLFTVNPPYWETWWFYTLIGFGIAFILFSLYRYRINHLLRLQKVRNTIATDLHDDIGSTLTNISILSELSKKNLEQPQAAEKLLQRITEESVASQQALDDIIWSVNTSNDNMQELQARMRRYVAEVFESSNIACEFNFENTGGDVKLNMEQRRDLYLVFKECMNNIHKHASAKNIYIKIAISNGVLNMQIEDDGKGFDPHITTHRNGLKNLETRVEKWKGDFKIDTAKEKGTKIEIIMPVKTSLLK